MPNKHKVKIHIGAHKTATTYIQSWLESHQGVIYDTGSAYWRLDQIRAPIRYGIDDIRKREQSKIRKILQPFKKQESRYLQNLASFFNLERDIIISEENLLGDASDIFKTGFYKNAANRLKYILPLIEHLDLDLEIWIGIRSYNTFYSSMYSEALRHGFYMPTNEAETKCMLNEGWIDLLATLHDVSPNAKIITWFFEDFDKIQNRLLSRLSGIQEGKFLNFDNNKKIRPSPSTATITEMNRIAEKMSRVERIQKMSSLENQFRVSKRESKFNLFSPENSLALVKKYNLERSEIIDLSYIECL